MTVNGVKLRKNGPFARAMGRSLDMLAQSLLDGCTGPIEPVRDWSQYRELTLADMVCDCGRYHILSDHVCEPYPPFPEPTFECECEHADAHLDLDPGFHVDVFDPPTGSYRVICRSCGLHMCPTVPFRRG